MNERIKQLALQAVEETQLLMIMEYKNFESKLYEKFAELLVRECAKIVEDSAWNLPHGYKAVDQASLVKQHFGVEE